MSRSTLLAALAFTTFAAFSFSVKSRLSDRADSLPGLPVGSPAPSFALPRLDGDAVDLAAAVGDHKVVVISFWATWCGPCRLELPQLEKAYADLHGRGLEILAITDESPEAVREYLARRPVGFPVLLDEGGAVAELYGVEALPTLVVLDERGVVSSSFQGLSPFFAKSLEARLEERTKPRGRVDG